MGFLSSLGKIAGIVSAPFTGGTSLIPTVLSTAADFAMTKMQEGSQKDAATTAFQRSIGASNTSYQRAVADMRAAGLNPALAYSQGGASTPQAAQAGVPEYPRIGSTAMAHLATRQQMAQTAAQTVNTTAQTVNTGEQTEYQRLINEGLRTVPPALRAAVASGSDAASGLLATGKALKNAPAAFGRGFSAVKKFFSKGK
jgi:hypothetical protein